MQWVVLGALVLALVYVSVEVWALSRLQIPGADYSCFWAGARSALSAPSRIYDFAQNTALQGWPLGAGRLRPYIYPPSALFLFIPFALAPYWIGYGLWVAVTGGLFLWATRRIGAPWLLAAIMPTVAFVAYCGQSTFAVGGLVLAGLALRDRPLISGVLLGLAAAVKPQLLVLVPIALAAEARWRTMTAAGITGAALCLAAAAVFGVQTWLDWLGALRRFDALIFQDPGLVEDAVTPYAALTAAGLDGAWALALAPLAAALVWAGFRRTRDLADRSLVLFGATILVTPYAMNYELALFAPGVAAYLARLRDPRWTRYAAAALGHFMLPWALPSVLPPLALGAAAVLGKARPASAQERVSAALDGRASKPAPQPQI